MRPLWWSTSYLFRLPLGISMVTSKSTAATFRVVASRTRPAVRRPGRAATADSSLEADPGPARTCATQSDRCRARRTSRLTATKCTAADRQEELASGGVANVAAASDRAIGSSCAVLVVAVIAAALIWYLDTARRFDRPTSDATATVAIVDPPVVRGRRPRSCRWPRATRLPTDGRHRRRSWRPSSPNPALAAVQRHRHRPGGRQRDALEPGLHRPADSRVHRRNC